MIANDNAKPQKQPQDAPGVEAWSGKDKGDENFPVGSLLIAKALRPHIHAYYTFARNADDISDSPSLSADEKIARLDAMEAVLSGTQTEGSPSAAKLRASLEETGVDAIHARELLIAFRQDATKTRYASWEELMQYCRYSAAPVGRYVLALHGESEATWPSSDALCASLQVLNHMQDCAKDLRDLDRCYIPQDWLAELGLGTDAIARGETVPDLRIVFDRMLELTEKLNEQAAELPGLVKSRRLRVETAVIAGLAKRLTAKLRSGDPLATRVKLTKLDFIAATLAALRYAA
ncbi:MAG: squalene synthase HpnC [Acidocella sp.]|nr:squalene synthase HpnC [Acidocella sp.]